MEKFCKLCGDKNGPFRSDRWRCEKCHKEFEKNRRIRSIDKIRTYNRSNQRKEKQLERATEFYKNNKEKVLTAFQKKYKGNEKEYHLRNILSKYQITRKEYENLFNKNDGKCAICYKVAKKMCVDHDHITGEIRGILCNQCNSGIGFLQDDIELLESALEYLKGNSSKEIKYDYSFFGLKGEPIYNN